MTTRQALLILALCAASPWAAADIYKCVDAQGRIELTDLNKPGCRRLDVPGALSAPAVGVAPRQRGSASPPSTAPANFPRVDAAQQKARDDDRKEILNDELRSERKKLADLKAEYKNGEPDRLGNERNYAKYQERVANLRDSIARTEKNIEALNREIGNIR